MAKVKRPTDWPRFVHHVGSAWATAIVGQSNAVEPSAVARSRGIAITDGDRARLGACAGSMRATTALFAASRVHTLDAGTHTSGAGPLSAESHGLASSVAMRAESRATTVTDTHTPSTAGFVLDQAASSSLSNGAMSGDAATTALSRPEQSSLIANETPTVSNPATSTATMTIAPPRPAARRSTQPVRADPNG